MKNPVMIFGLNPIARAAKAIFDSNEIITYGFLTDEPKQIGQEIDEVSVLGKMEDDGYLKFIGKKCEAFVALDENSVRKHVVKLLKEKRKVMPVNAIHAQAFIAASAIISHGNFINMGVMVGHDAVIGNHCILHSGAIIEVDVELEDFVQVGTGAILSAGVKVEEGAFIGAGALIVAGVTIGKNARVGAGSVVIADVESKQTVFGNPAQVVNQ